MDASNDDVHQLLTAIVSSLSNTLYDLSVDNERNNNKVTAKRLEFSRQKVMSAWEVYNQNRANK